MKATITAAACLLLLSACSLHTLLPDTAPSDTQPPSANLSTAPYVFTVHGTVSVPDMVALTDDNDGSPCTSDDGYDDIAEGSQVTVLDGSGTKLAIGALDSGEIDGYQCSFSFTVPEVPDGEPLYDIAVGNEFRGAVSFNRSDLDFAVAIGF